MESAVASRKPIAGAYALLGGGVDERDVYREFARLELGGLEVPLHAEGASPAFPLRHPDELDPEWTCIITCIPVVMAKLLPTREFGLAASDETARREAVSDVLRAIRASRNAADLAGRAVVSGIEIHTAPGPTRGRRDSMMWSLDSLLEEEDVPTLIVEHCDAEIAGREPSKGFWSLDDEIALVSHYGAVDRVALGVNWGRSAIEGRGADQALAHVVSARESGMLRSLIFSGATDQHTLWGDAWGDAHIPPRGTDPRLRESSASLLGADEIASAVAAAGSECVIGFKVSARPDTASLRERVEVAAATTALITAALQVT